MFSVCPIGRVRALPEEDRVSFAGANDPGPFRLVRPIYVRDLGTGSHERKRVTGRRITADRDADISRTSVNTVKVYYVRNARFAAGSDARSRARI